jgi:stringent starvation protein B
MDCGFTPYLAVQADDSVQVPREFVKNGEIVLNISPDATSGLEIGDEWVEFKARFNGVARDILVPIDRVLAIYARENGQGMAFPTPAPGTSGTTAVSSSSTSSEPPQEPPPPPTRPTLTRIK